MTRCFLLEVKKRGVKNHLFNIVNPCFLSASSLKGLVISDRVKKKESGADTGVTKQENNGTAESFFSVFMSATLPIPSCSAPVDFPDI